jgi:type II secretory pathway pseudopilin PulG
MRGNRRHGYTLFEMIVAFGVFGLFAGALLALFRSGQTSSQQTFWLQKTGTQMRITMQHVHNALSRSSYPSTIIFPGTIIENSRNDFKVHISGREVLNAADALQSSDPQTPGTFFLRFVEAFPERQKGPEENPASLTYHIYSLTNSGKILYHRYMESLSTSGPLYVNSLRRTQIPPEGSVLIETQMLADDVAALRFTRPEVASTPNALEFEISCVNPKGKTRRSERFSGVPNVGVVVHPFAPEW